MSLEKNEYHHDNAIIGVFSTIFTKFLIKTDNDYETIKNITNDIKNKTGDKYILSVVSAIETHIDNVINKDTK